MSALLKGTFTMRYLLLALLYFGFSVGDAAAENPAPLTMIVMDPLAAPLSCPCVKGYAQRDYEALAKHLEKSLGRSVKVHFAETLGEALRKKSEGKADVIIGKESVVKAHAKELTIPVHALAALTGKDGKTTQTGLVVVAGLDPAITVTDLKGYRVIFGNEECDEKYQSPLSLLRENGIFLPDKRETCNACSDGAVKVIDGHKGGEKIATVISSYAQPLLEGCGTIKKGDLRVVGETDPVPFIVAFASGKLRGEERAALEKALLEIGKVPELCQKLETKSGFVALPVAKKK